MWQPSNVSSRSESRGSDLTTSRGAALGNGNANVKAAWVNLGAATSFAYEAITVCYTSRTGLAAAENQLVDIGVSDGTNRWILCADLYSASQKLIHAHGFILYIPVHVPADAQLSARMSGSVGGTINPVGEVTVIGYASGLGGAPGFSRCVALFTPASSRGVAVDPGATANTKGAWAQMTASCPEDIGAMFGMIGYNNDVSRAAAARALIDIGIGAASSEFVLRPNALVCWSTVKDGPANCPGIPLFACNVPKTTRIAARAACSLNTAGDRTVDLALYGLVL
jgi:hypothetical protein